MECVPNFSEGRDLQKIDKIVAPFRSKQGVKLLDYSNDEDHNRLVVTVVGEPEPLRDAVLEAIGVAVELIDLNHHQGQHHEAVPARPLRSPQGGCGLHRYCNPTVSHLVCPEKELLSYLSSANRALR